MCQTNRKLKGLLLGGMLAMGGVFDLSARILEGHPENVEDIHYPSLRSDPLVLSKADFHHWIDALSNLNTFMQTLQTRMDAPDWAQNERRECDTLFGQMMPMLVEAGVVTLPFEEEDEDNDVSWAFSVNDREIFHEISAALVGARSRDAQQALADVRAYFDQRFGQRTSVILGRW